MTAGNADVQILLSLNSLVGSDYLFDRVLVGVFNNPLIRGFPIFFFLIVLWFLNDCIKRRSRILIGLFATCVATVLSVWLQHHTTPHVRPLIDPALHLNILDPKWISMWDRRGSFPSDTGTLYFSLIAVIFLENRKLGWICFFWAFCTVGVMRVALAWHYPSDIIGSFVLGAGVIIFQTNSIP